MVVVFGLIMLDNGQWLDCGGIPRFCPDNSPSYYDLDEDEDPKIIEFRKKCKIISEYSSLIEPLPFELESQAEIEFDEF